MSNVGDPYKARDIIFMEQTFNHKPGNNTIVQFSSLLVNMMMDAFIPL